MTKKSAKKGNRAPISDKPVLKSAQSLSDFIAIVENLKPATQEGLWFRGQSKASRQLIPGALRELDTLTDGRFNPVAPGTPLRGSGGLMAGPSPEDALAAYKRGAVPFLKTRPSNDFEWMFLAQHHGLKTRLLDWSTNALAALYFAANTASVSEGDGGEACESFEAGEEHRGDGFAVFIIDPGQFNEKAHGIRGVVDIAAEPERWASYLDPIGAGLEAYLPICVSAPHVSSRIRAQSGNFTLHGANIDPIDYYTAFRPLITKIFLPYTATTRVRAGLRLAGVTASFIYPGLDTLANDINEDELRRYLANR